jgi:hypothetical protein
MDAFITHQQVVKNYRYYLSTFHSIQDARITDEVSLAISSTGFITEAHVQIIPSFRIGEIVSIFEKSFLFFAMKSDITLLTDKLVAVMDTGSIRQEITEQLQVVTKF